MAQVVRAEPGTKLSTFPTAEGVAILVLFVLIIVPIVGVGVVVIVVVVIPLLVTTRGIFAPTKGTPEPGQLAKGAAQRYGGGGTSVGVGEEGVHVAVDPAAEDAALFRVHRFSRIAILTRHHANAT